MPLLYQGVATSVLSPGQIASPIRGILWKQRNTMVILAEVTAVNKEQHCVLANSRGSDGHTDSVRLPHPRDGWCAAQLLRASTNSNSSLRA